MATEARRELIAQQAEERDQVDKTSDSGTTTAEKGGLSSKAQEGSDVEDASGEGASLSKNGQHRPNNQLPRKIAEAFLSPPHPSTGSLLDLAY